MRLLPILFAANALLWPAAGPAAAQPIQPAQPAQAMETLVTESGVYRVPARQPKRWSRSSAAATPSVAAPSAAVKGSTDFDLSAVAADRARKAATLELAERERNAYIKPGSANCVIKPVMTNADMAACRSH